MDQEPHPPWPTKHDARTGLAALVSPPAILAERALAVRGELLRASPGLADPRFTRIQARDLRTLFAAYDRVFFSGRLTGMLDRWTGGPLELRLSSRLTSAGAKTYRKGPRAAGGAPPRFEIAVSSHLLLQSFVGEGRDVFVSGVLCRDRLDALQRIFEHELIHLAEWIAWDESSCAAGNFRQLARQIFGHQGTKHGLVTRRELAATHYDLRVGDAVVFAHEGRTLRGVVNRITHRATVLVESPQGAPYSDGKRYAKFYVPLRSLAKAMEAGAGAGTG